jgi:NADH-quinone oxidoreductase subunit D
MAALGEMLEGYLISDIITTFGMINMIGGECDR